MKNRKMLHIGLGVTLVTLVVLSLSNALANFTWSDQLDLFLDVRNELVQNYVEEPDQEKMSQEAVRGMISSLDDPYTIYISPEDLKPFDASITGSFTGIGAEVDQHERRLRIVSPLQDSPAWDAGVRAGDIVLEIDGESTLDLPLREAVSKLTGEKGSQVHVLVLHESGEKEELTITRDTINVHTVRGFVRDNGGDYNYMLDPNRKIGYVRITQFTSTTARDLTAALEQLEDAGMKALIIDVRFNPGGLLTSAVEVLDLFLHKGARLVSIEGRSQPKEVYDATEGTTIPDVPIVVLANEASASAAEILTGALKDNDRGLFVGTRTFGKGSVQQVKALPGGKSGAIKLTTAYYYLPSGRNIHKREGQDTWGVDPSEGAYVAMTPEEIESMLKVRRDKDVLRKVEDQGDDKPVTPGFIREEIKDPQLAAALEAAVGKLDTGEWPRVGGDNVQELVREGRERMLVARRDALTEAMAAVQKELAELEAGGPVDGAATQAADEAADASDRASDSGAAVPDAAMQDLSPTDPARVRDRIDAADERPVPDPMSPPATQPLEMD